MSTQLLLELLVLYVMPLLIAGIFCLKMGFNKHNEGKYFTKTFFHNSNRVLDETQDECKRDLRGLQNRMSIGLMVAVVAYIIFIILK